MTGNYDFIGCAKRMGAILIGRTEPSVTAVKTAAHEVVQTAEAKLQPDSLRTLWNKTVAESIPPEFQRLLDNLPEDLPVVVVPIRAAR